MLVMRYLGPLLATFTLFAQASAQTPSAVPDRRIPPSVLAEVRALQDRFEAALALDCAPERCFPKGCTYGAHAVADRPADTSLPGLAEKAGPGSGPRQEYLTLARCTFAHEKDMSRADAVALVRRLRTKLTRGWTVVQVSRQSLPAISPELRRAPPPEPAEEPPVVEAPPPVEPTPPEPDVWEPTVAGRELWVNLLPHFAWMVAVVMLTIAAMILIWGWRRLGRLSPEEQVLLSQIGPEQDPGPEDGADSPSSEPPPAAPAGPDYAASQRAYWASRLADSRQPDSDTRALVAHWLEAGEMGLLAKAVLTFPEALPAAFPDDGAQANAKLRFSEFLRDVRPDALPSDEEFYQQLQQHALAAALAHQDGANAVQTLRASFGPAGLVRTMGALPPRHSALLFAHASVEDQFEASRLLTSTATADICEQLLASNRMSKSESTYLFELLQACRDDRPPPPPPTPGEVSDLGATFDAAGALSVLLPLTDATERSTLLSNARTRFGGSFPQWYRGILFAELVIGLEPELRADVLLETDSRKLAGWLSTIPGGGRTALLSEMSGALRAAVLASSDFSSPRQRLALYEQGRAELAEALHQQLAKRQLSFEQVMV